MSGGACYLGLQSIGLVKHDGQQDGLFDEDEDEQERQRLVVLHGADDFEGRRHETDEDVDQGDEHHEAEAFVDHVDQLAGQRVVPPPLLQADVQDPADGVAVRDLLHLVQVDDLLVDSLEDEGGDPGQDEEEQEDAGNDGAGEVGQDDGQRAHQSHVPVERVDGNEQLAGEILDNTRAIEK